MCRFVSDLSVGAIAQQDPAGSAQGSHMAFAAKQELSGWQQPTLSAEEQPQDAAAATLKPRLFVVFEDGSGYEVLDNDLFAAYSERKASCRSVLCLLISSCVFHMGVRHRC